MVDPGGRRRTGVSGRHVSLAGRTLFITGASRGIGLAIGLRAARDGANVVVAAKTDTPHPKLEGTIHTAAARIEAAGGHALPIACDVRDEAQIEAAIAACVARFGGLDILVNNASAIGLTGTEATPSKRYDLMQQVNARGTFLCCKHAIPHLRRSDHAHILMLSPPPTLDPRWYAPHVAYTLAKMGMSLIALGLAEELRPDGIAVNALWPRTTIATAAVANLLGGPEMMRRSRTPDIVADAAHVVLSGNATGRFFIDEDVLAGRDLGPYAVERGMTVETDLFV